MRKVSPWFVALVGLSLTAVGCGSSSPTSASPPITFTGNFNGTYQISSCSDGPLTGFCATGFNVGTRLPITMSLGQNGTSVSGNVALGNLTGNFQGTANGATMTGTAPLSSLTENGVQLLTSIIQWNSSISGNAMQGTFTVTFTVVGIGGNAGMTATIITLTR